MADATEEAQAAVAPPPVAVPVAAPDPTPGLAEESTSSVREGEGDGNRGVKRPHPDASATGEAAGEPAEKKSAVEAPLAPSGATLAASAAPTAVPVAQAQAAPVPVPAPVPVVAAAIPVPAATVGQQLPIPQVKKETKAKEPKLPASVVSCNDISKLPFSKGTIKRIMKLGACTEGTKNVSVEAVQLIGQASVLFLESLAKSSSSQAAAKNRATSLKYQDVFEARASDPKLLFLDMVVPVTAAVLKDKQGGGK